MLRRRQLSSGVRLGPPLPLRLLNTLGPLVRSLGLWPRVDTLVPVNARRLGTWESITIVGAGPKPVTIGKPSSAYPELVPAIFPGDGGKPAFGMFDPVELGKHGQPALRENAVSEIKISLAKNSGRGENEPGFPVKSRTCGRG